MPLDGQELALRVYNLNKEGARLQAVGNYEAARFHYMGALLINPNDPVVLTNLAGACYSLHQYKMGAVCARKALRLDPNNFHAKNNLAINLVSLGLVDEARRHLLDGLKLSPNDQPIHHTLGGMFYRQNKFVEAAGAFRKAIELGYDAYAPRNDLAMATLAQGRLEEGFAQYEIRWQELYKNPHVWGLGIPEWQGEDVNGKTILIHHEQGFGDSLMLVRFAKNLDELGAKVSIATHKVLVRLFKENFPKLPVYDCENLPDYIKSDPSQFDFHSPMLSVLRHLKLKVHEIDPSPYLAVEENLLRPLPGKFKVGLCWSSGDHGVHLETRRRVTSLDKYLPLLETPGIQVVSLQMGQEAKEVEQLGAESMIINFMHRVADWYDSARIIKELDLVISVDTAVAHLAGAMGKEVYMLGPYPRCWRWWKQPEGLPWYSKMKIFTQSPDLSWDPAIRRVISEVHKRRI